MTTPPAQPPIRHATPECVDVGSGYRCLSPAHPPTPRPRSSASQHSIPTMGQSTPCCPLCQLCKAGSATALAVFPGESCGTSCMKKRYKMIWNAYIDRKRALCQHTLSSSQQTHHMPDVGRSTELFLPTMSETESMLVALASRCQRPVHLNVVASQCSRRFLGEFVDACFDMNANDKTVEEKRAFVCMCLVVGV